MNRMKDFHLGLIHSLWIVASKPRKRVKSGLIFLVICTYLAFSIKVYQYFETCFDKLVGGLRGETSLLVSACLSFDASTASDMFPLGVSAFSSLSSCSESKLTHVHLVYLGYVANI